MLSNLPAGYMLGPYKIIQKIGRGGMATVYKAYQETMDRYVAIKVLSFQFMNHPEILGRFQHEARVIARLEHPHILPVYEYGESDGIPYMVMRYLEAGTLKERLTSGPISMPEIDHIFTQLADALAYAHENGVIHRDIKPTNAMLDKRNQVFLTDFGIAKLIEGSPEFTATGAVTGTPAYMSPEQVHGLKLDPRTDIYSLGIMLYEMITGRVPFEAETPMAVILKQVQEPLPPLSKFKVDVHPAIEAVVLKALSKDREERYQDVPAFLTAWKKAYQESTSSPIQAVQPVTFVNVPVQNPASQQIHQVSEPASVSAPPVQKLAAQKPLETIGVSRIAQPPLQPLAKQSTWSRLPNSLKLALPGLLLCLCMVVMFGVFKFIENRIQSSFNIIGSQTPSASTQVSLTPHPGSTTGSQAGTQGQINQPALRPGWQTWSAANTYFTVMASDELVVAGGYGGLTIWDDQGANPQTLTVRNGIPGDTVLSMFPEESDIFWIGTNEGLARISNNGATWEKFGMTNGLDSDYISSIVKTDQGMVFSTQYSGVPGGGLNFFDGKVFSRIEMPSTDSELMEPGKLSYHVNTMVYQPGVGLWVGTWHGLGLYTQGQWTVYQGELDNNPFVTSLLVDHENHLWVGLIEGKVLRFSDGTFTRIGDLNEHGVYNVLGIVEDNQGQVWFAGYNGVVSYNPTTDEWNSYTTDLRNIPASSILSAGRSPSGILYFGTEKQGLLRFADGHFSSWYLTGKLTYGRVTSIIPAPDGKLWFRSESGGIEVYEPASQNYLPEPVFDFCCLAAWGQDGTGWFVSGDGIRILRGERVTHLDTDYGLPSSDTYQLIITGNNEAWASTSGGLAHIINDKVVETYTPADGLPGSYHPALLQSSDGSLWIGSDMGLSRRSPDGQWAHFLKGQTFNENLQVVMDIVEDKQRGVIWVAAMGEGLFRFDGNEWQNYLPDEPGVEMVSPDIQTLSILPDGRLAMGFAHGGLVFFDPENSRWETYGVQDGLAHQNVTDIYVAVDNSIWLATTGGITRITTAP